MKITVTIEEPLGEEIEFKDTQSFTLGEFCADETTAELTQRIDEWVSYHPMLYKNEDEKLLVSRGWQKVWDSADAIQGWWWKHPKHPNNYCTRSAALHIEGFNQ